MGNLVVRTLDGLVFVQVRCALEAEGVATWERDGLLIVMVVCFEAHPTFENGIDGLGHQNNNDFESIFNSYLI